MCSEELKITREIFIDVCQDYCKEFNNNKTVENGISPRSVNSICENMMLHIMYLILVKNVSLNIFRK